MQDLKELIKKQLAKNNLEHLGAILDNTDNKTELSNIIDLMIKRGFITLDSQIKLYLFKKLYISGCYCYTPINSQDFKDNYEYIKPDLEVIASIVDSTTLSNIDYEHRTVQKELYLMDDPLTLMDIMD